MTRYTHGDQVITDKDIQGAIVSVYAQWRGVDEPVYDVQPNNERSMTARLCGVPESRLRAYGLRLVREA